MASLEEIRQTRLEKLKLLMDSGIDAYPATAKQDLTCKQAEDTFEELEKLGDSKSMVGRILSLREQGKIIFFNFNDGTGNFQALLKSGEPLPEEVFELFRTPDLMLIFEVFERILKLKSIKTLV